MMRASRNGHVEVIRFLLTDGRSPINLTSQWGGTALFYAAWNGHVEVARLLLQAGADPTIPADNGRSALSVARERQCHAVVALLEVRIEEVV